MSLASSLLVGSWPWSAAEFLVALVAIVAAAARHVSLAARSDGDDAERTRALVRRAEVRAAFLAGGRALAAVAGVIVVAWLAFAATPAARAHAWAFAIGVVVAAAAAVAVGALEHSGRVRAAVASRISPDSALEIAWEGGLAAIFVVTAAQVAATWIVGATTEETGAPLGLAAGVLLVAWFAQSARTFAPATARAIALMSAQTFALAAVASASARIAGGGSDALLRPDLVHFGRLLVALGAVAPLAFRGAVPRGAALRGAAHVGEVLHVGATRPLARQLLAPIGFLLAAGLVCGLFVGPVAAVARGPAAGYSAIALALLCGVALVVVVARVAEHGAIVRSERVGDAGGDALVTLPSSRFVPCLVVAAAVVVAASALGTWGIALAAAAAAAALPICVAAGFGADLLPTPPAEVAVRSSAVERAVSSATVAIAGWATLGAARGVVRLDLLSADVTGGAVVGVALAIFMVRNWVAASGRAESAGNSNSTRADLRAMIVPALLAVAAPFCVARLNPAAGGGMAAGALLGGATAALLASRSTAALFDRVVSLVCITFVLCSR